MWKKILVTVDGSNLAEQAFPYAEEIAVAFNSEVILLYVNEPDEEKYLNMHQLYINEVAERMRERVKKVSPVLLSGKPDEEIISYAEKNDIELMIMASHGHSGVKSWAVGDTACKVINDTAVPLLLVKATKSSRKVPEKGLLSRILLPLDGSKAGEAAVDYVKELKTRLEAEVILFGVVPAEQRVRTVGGLDYIRYPERQMDAVRVEAKEYLDKIYQRLKKGKGEVKIDIKAGDVAREITRAAGRKRAKLLAIASHGHTGMTKWVFGSIAQKVVQASKVPVLLVKTKGLA